MIALKGDKEIIRPKKLSKQDVASVRTLYNCCKTNLYLSIKIKYVKNII